jgi:hypothetical protein
MKCRWLILLLLIGTASCGTEIEPPGTKVHSGVQLLAGLASYSTEQEARMGINASAHDWRDVARTPHPVGDRRPRLDQLTIDVDVVECGQEGTLRLMFFNNRLESTVFTPREWEACRLDLERRGIQVNGIAVHERVAWSETDGKGRRFIGLADERLRREVSEWISRYS